MKKLLLILALLWIIYRMTPLNGVVNEYLALEDTMFDTTYANLIGLFTGDQPVVEGYSFFYVQHILLTFVPAIVLVGVSLAL